MLTARDVMEVPRLILDACTNVTEVASEMRHAGTTTAVVAPDDHGHYGIIERERVEALTDTKAPRPAPVGDVCRRMSLAVHPDAALSDVAHLMTLCNLDRLAVVQGRTLVGVVDRSAIPTELTAWPGDPGTSTYRAWAPSWPRRSAMA